jgi:hypothetical protein
MQEESTVVAVGGGHLEKFLTEHERLKDVEIFVGTSET